MQVIDLTLVTPPSVVLEVSIGARGPIGPQGVSGDDGPQGEIGPQGDPGPPGEDSSGITSDDVNDLIDGRIGTLTQAEFDSINDSLAIYALDSALSNESLDRLAADTALDIRLDAVEALGSLATDSELAATLATLIGSADVDGDTLGELQTLISLRATAAQLATTNANLISEATARANADTTLQTNINNEATARANADTTLQTNINAKAPSASPTFTGTVTLPDPSNTMTAAARLDTVERTAPRRVSGQWYSQEHCSTANSAAISSNVIRAVPYLVRRRGGFARLGVGVTAGVVSSDCRIGVYLDDGTYLYPGSLVVDTGVIATTGTAVLADAAAVTGNFEIGTLIWLVFKQGTTGGVTYRGTADQNPHLPTPTATLAPNTSLTLAGSAGALPGTFAAGATVSNANTPLIRVQVA